MKKVIGVIIFLVFLSLAVTALADMTAKVNNAEGTVVVTCTRACKVKVVAGENSYAFTCSPGENVLPLVWGNGRYSVTEYIHYEGNQYIEMDSISLIYCGYPEEAYRHPNTLVKYSDDCLAVRKAAELCADAETDKEKVSAVWQYVISNYYYDYIQAINIKANNAKRPDVDIDAVFSAHSGVCYDLSIMTCAMLRSQGVTASVEVGDGHAWVIAYADGKKLLVDPAARLQTGKNRMAGFKYKASEQF